MIKGIGTDIVDIRRIEKLVNKSGWEVLANKILTEKEIAELPQHEEKRIARIAKRFAAKEAISKAYGWGIGSEIKFHDIEITNNEKGAPLAHVKNRKEKIHLSLSDEHPYAIAYVIIESEK